MYMSLLKFLFWFFTLIFCSLTPTLGQDNLYARFTTGESRARLYRNLIGHSINTNMGRPLNDDTEEYWIEGFGALELLLYKNSWVTSRIDHAFDSIPFRSSAFQRALLELAYANYPGTYLAPVSALLQQTGDAKIFAMCAEYILLQKRDSLTLDSLEEALVRKFAFTPDDPIISRLYENVHALKFPARPYAAGVFIPLLSRNFFPGQIVMYSLQRKNRDYPGLAVVRNREGKFIRDSAGIFNVPQLGRSISNLPCYLTNGNTPAGIFRMHGFDVSRSNFIGPSPNVQLSLPVEMSPRKFLDDSTIRDTAWSLALYSNLLPSPVRQYSSLYHTFYAGLAGRTEIIAHGTTIDPEYYKGQHYYPLTPSLGCLCTKEIWDGKRMESSQQKLVNALLKAGGAYGYCAVIELDDKEGAVTLEEVLPYLLKAESVK